MLYLHCTCINPFSIENPRRIKDGFRMRYNESEAIKSCAFVLANTPASTKPQITQTNSEVANIVNSIIYTLQQLQQKKKTSKNININDNQKTSYIKYVLNNE